MGCSFVSQCRVHKPNTFVDPQVIPITLSALITIHTDGQDETERRRIFPSLFMPQPHVATLPGLSSQTLQSCLVRVQLVPLPTFLAFTKPMTLLVA